MVFKDPFQPKLFYMILQFPIVNMNYVFALGYRYPALCDFVPFSERNLSPDPNKKSPNPIQTPWVFL